MSQKLMPGMVLKVFFIILLIEREIEFRRLSTIDTGFFICPR